MDFQPLIARCCPEGPSDVLIRSSLWLQLFAPEHNFVDEEIEKTNPKLFKVSNCLHIHIFMTNGESSYQRLVYVNNRH